MIRLLTACWAGNRTMGRKICVPILPVFFVPLVERAITEQVSRGYISDKCSASSLEGKRKVGLLVVFINLPKLPNIIRSKIVVFKIYRTLLFDPYLQRIFWRITFATCCVIKNLKSIWSEGISGWIPESLYASGSRWRALFSRHWT